LLSAIFLGVVEKELRSGDRNAGFRRRITVQLTFLRVFSQSRPLGRMCTK
jgi:hypothetical protein